MAGHKRPGGPSGGAGPKATVFRKSAKKQRLDSEQTQSKPESKGQGAHSKQKERGQRPPSANGNGKPRHRDGAQSGKGPKTTIPSRGKDEVALKKIGSKDSKGKPKPRSNAAPEKKKAGSETLMPSTMEIPPPPAPATSFRILAGSYERLLYGFHVTFQQQQQQASSSSAQQLQPAFRPIFSFAAHTSSISALAAAGADSKWLATGAGDETVRVWDLRKRKEVGGLTGHGGTILNLSFPARTYLLSTDSSGLINLYRTRDWSLLKTLRGHTGAVNACRAHPSCRLALSVGKDGMLRMWDLMRGKGAGAVRLNLGVPARDEDEEEDEEDDEDEDLEEVARSRKRKVPAEEPLDVVWSQSGTHFAVMGRTVVNVYQTDMKLVGAVRVPKDAARKKMASVAFAPSDRDEDGAFLCVGKEEGVVELYDVQENLKQAKAVWDEPSCVLKGHGNRVKSISSIQVVTSPEENKTTRLIVTISSDGKIRIFDIGGIAAGAKGEEVEAIATHDTGGARLTCLGVVGGSGGLAAEREAQEEELDEDDGDGDDEDADLSGSNVEGGTDEELDPEEAEELQRLLDLVDEARAQGVEVEGMSDLEGLLEEPDEDDESSGEDDEEEGEEEEDEMEDEDDE
ncbi:WD40 repeat-like protein [Acaromyces ingoldii]|uniref:WD40 repeat-like protein n=1 Tax=Acaromyces ingoldii TaxID=215250 RepID=A0A316YLC0_9BASI|nr:WD40 repeat-like protein [Acaromyces ingoldii]PWN90177.1 WD40 repeat-like protein [Acaromyces ingoldii]